MPRERTTWNRAEIAKRASLSKQADPYTMNQDHAQPSHDQYVIGGPSDFAEDVHPSNGTWEAEYSGGQVKRNEIGMPEFRSDTFNHPEKTASESEIIMKASLAVNVAKAMLPKTASQSLIEEQASRLMRLSNDDLAETYKALVAQEEQQDGQAEDQGKQAQEEQQASQAEDQGKQAQDQSQEQAAEDQGKQAQEEQQASQAEDQGKQAQMQAQGFQQMLAQLQQLQQQVAQLMQAQQGQQAQQQVVQAQEEQQAHAQEQVQVQEDQGQDKQAAADRIRAAMDAALAAGADPVVAAMQAVQGCMGQGPQQAMADDDQLVDQMLAQQEPMVADMDIELDAPAMDVGDTAMTAQDSELLAQIFASEEMDQAQQAQGQQKQAHAMRTASTRTVGTRPTHGVSQLGGLPSANAKDDLSKLSSMWSSAPDVREAFGINR